MASTNDPTAAKVDDAAELLSNVALGLAANDYMTTRAALLNRLIDAGDKDINAECDYPSAIGVADYKEMYDREGIGSRVVKMMPEECWCEDPTVKEDEDANETQFEEAFRILNERHNVWHYLARIDELSGIGHFGLLLIGLDDGQELKEPVRGMKEDGTFELPDGENNRALRITYLRTFDESLVDIAGFENDDKNPRFGQPTKYNIQFADPTKQGQSTVQLPDVTEKEVHWSRVIHIADNRGSSEILGMPRMQQVWNRLIDLRKVLGGSGEMFWKGAFPGLSLEVDPELGDVDLDKKSIREEMANYQNGLQRYFALAGIKANSLAPQIADPDKHMTALLTAIAITLGSPMRILMGTEEAKLASSQDSKNWNKKVKKRQVKYVTPMVIQPFVVRCISYGILPTPVEYEPDVSVGFTVEWPDLNSPTDLDKISVVEKMVNAIAKYMQSGADLLVPPKEFMIHVLEWDEETADAILEAAEERILEEEESARVELEEMEQQQQLPDQDGNTDDQALQGEGGQPVDNDDHVHTATCQH